MPSHQEVYTHHGLEYEALVSREDYEGNIIKSLRGIVQPEGLDVVDLGAGTGRLADLLAPMARSILAFDVSRHMLTFARDKLKERGADLRWMTAAADHRRIPVHAGVADLMVSGWSVSYVAHWHPETWRAELEAWLEEARRVLRPGSHIVLYESLGTGNETPVRLPHLGDFYDWLDESGFANDWIRTDYRFETAEIAANVTSFFFGDEMRGKIVRGTAITLPECTGVWWLRV